MQHKLGLWILIMVAAMPAWSQSQQVQLGPMEVYKDWVVGCDNGLSCQAVSLVPEVGDVSEDSGGLVIGREPGADDMPTIELVFEEGDAAASKAALSIVVDGRVLTTATGTTLQGKAALDVARALAQGRVLEVRHGSTVVVKPSLAGASAALRFMDAKQNRAGGASALVAIGPKPASAVPAAPALPKVVPALIAVKTEPRPLTDEELERAVEVAGCVDEESEDSPQETTLYALDAERTLALVPCGHGAYNFNSVAVIVRGKVGSRQFARVRYDNDNPAQGDEPHYLTNADWDPKQAAISEYSKGRGLGDCGVSRTFTWDGSRMRLTFQAEMPECRGSQEMITLWQAETR